uniref:Uncharacterized protein n=1 Tax=Candidatus Kentrum sp. FW TaxID=2126338 RepID=A0A450T8Q1_9GAMM|nr:MAG: hypothetical protein BECKFW1821C_GA0114237_100386 [Candidatus Kentron sp. FW]
MPRITGRRRYLRNQYQRSENTFTVSIDGEEVEKPMPIVTIYVRCWNKKTKPSRDYENSHNNCKGANHNG